MSRFGEKLVAETLSRRVGDFTSVRYALIHSRHARAIPSGCRTSAAGFDHFTYSPHFCTFTWTILTVVTGEINSSSLEQQDVRYTVFISAGFRPPLIPPCCTPRRAHFPISAPIAMVVWYKIAEMRICKEQGFQGSHIPSCREIFRYGWQAIEDSQSGYQS